MRWSVEASRIQFASCSLFTASRTKLAGKESQTRKPVESDRLARIRGDQSRGRGKFRGRTSKSRRGVGEV